MPVERPDWLPTLPVSDALYSPSESPLLFCLLLFVLGFGGEASS